MNDLRLDTGRVGRNVLTVKAVPSELATLLAAAARQVTGARYAFATVAGAAASSGEGVGGAGTSVVFDGGAITVEGDVDATALEELAGYAAAAAPRAVERARHREVNAVVRHDVRTSIGVGMGFVAMLERHYDALSPSQRAAALDGLRASFDRLGRHVSRQLVDDQLELGELRPHPSEVPLAALLAAVGGAYPALVVDIDRSAPREVCADPQMLREVLDNLVDNAFAAAPEGSAVTLAVTADDASVRFAVRDLGPGFSAADRLVLFERYAHTEASRAGRAKGLGLGLSIVRRMVTAHGGQYGITGGDGTGTTVWVTFPRDVA